MKNVLITGGAGFIGANFVEYLLRREDFMHVIVLDKLTYAGSTKNLKEVWHHPRYTFIQGDIADATLLKNIFDKYVITDILRIAKETHVENSIVQHEHFIYSH